MRQRKYIKPQTKVKKLKITLLNTISGGDVPWDNAKRNNISDFEIQEGIDELDQMFE